MQFDGDGDVTITFAASYNDPYGVAGAWTPTHAIPALHATTGGDVGAVPSASAVNVYITSGGVAVQDATVSVSIW